MNHRTQKVFIWKGRKSHINLCIRRSDCGRSLSVLWLAHIFSYSGAFTIYEENFWKGEISTVLKILIVFCMKQIGIWIVTTYRICLQVRIYLFTFFWVVKNAFYQKMSIWKFDGKFLSFFVWLCLNMHYCEKRDLENYIIKTLENVHFNYKFWNLDPIQCLYNKIWNFGTSKCNIIYILMQIYIEMQNNIQFNVDSPFNGNSK